MDNSIVTILVGILFFCIIIMVHELGHFTAAKLFKMRVYEFAFGMGPILFKKIKDDTVYCIKAIPFGGSVQLGEDDEDSDNPEAFRNKPVWQRMIVILAGAAMNLLLGLIICIIISCVTEMIPSTVIHSFREDAVSSAQLQAGDEIVAVNGATVFTADELSYHIYNTESKMTAAENEAAFDITVKRGDEKIVLRDVIFKAKTNENGGKSIYYDFYLLAPEKNFLTITEYSVKNTVALGRIVLMSLRDLLKGVYGLNDMSGPVGVVTEIQNVAESGVGIDRLLTLFALITVNVGIFNLLPIPALDGARFVFFLVEAIRRKPVKAELEGMVHFIGFAALMLFMLVITFNDVFKLMR